MLNRFNRVLIIGTLLVTAQCKAPPTLNDGFVSIFDGNSMEGWKVDPRYWRVENQILTGGSSEPMPNHSFAMWQGGRPSDFELKLEFRISGTSNSGIQYRSEELPDREYALKGYQFDIDAPNQYTGQNYEQSGRTTLAYRGQKTIVRGPEDSGASIRDYVERNAWTLVDVEASLGNIDSLATYIKKDDWNEVHLIAKGNHMLHYVNGVLMSDVTDNDAINRKMEGVIGLQAHQGPPMKVEYRNIRIKQD